MNDSTQNTTTIEALCAQFMRVHLTVSSYTGVVQDKEAAEKLAASMGMTSTHKRWLVRAQLFESQDNEVKLYRAAVAKLRTAYRDLTHAWSPLQGEDRTSLSGDRLVAKADFIPFMKVCGQLANDCRAISNRFIENLDDNIDKELTLLAQQGSFTPEQLADIRRRLYPTADQLRRKFKIHLKLEPLAAPSDLHRGDFAGSATNVLDKVVAGVEKNMRASMGQITVDAVTRLRERVEMLSEALCRQDEWRRSGGHNADGTPARRPPWHDVTVDKLFAAAERVRGANVLQSPTIETMLAPLLETQPTLREELSTTVRGTQEANATPELERRTRNLLDELQVNIAQWLEAKQLESV